MLLTEVYGYQCQCSAEGFEWFKDIKEGRINTVDDPKLGCPSTVKNQENIEVNRIV